MIRQIWLLMTLMILVGACTPAPEQYAELETKFVDPGNARLLILQVDNGEVLLSESESLFLELDGQVLFPDKLEYQVSVTEEQISVHVFSRDNSSKRLPLRLVVRVPPQLQASLETDRASVLIQDYHGNLEVSSTSGDIMAEQVSGTFIMRSNRGNITVRESTGKVNVVGNYGALFFKGTRGETAASTIMGNVLYEGLIQADDSVRLEADHGAVSVKLSADSALTLHVRSASGDVACMLSGIDSAVRTCDGVIASGGGSLSVRTVSGAVTVQLLP
jgi:DUF4097 and DUF4098 domain-containing protein YvlB